MAATPAGAPPRAATSTTDIVTIVLVVTGITQLVPGLLAFLAPAAFYDLLAPFPPENHHILRDVGSWQIALGLGALVAVRVPSFRVPMLGLLTLQLALHAISHLINIDDPDPSWLGPVEFATLAGGAVLVGGLFVRELRR
jgi:hypothetical protein